MATKDVYYESEEYYYKKIKNKRQEFTLQAARLLCCAVKYCTHVMDTLATSIMYKYAWK